MDLHGLIEQLFYQAEQNDCKSSIDFDMLYSKTIESIESNYLNVKLWADILHTYLIKILQTLDPISDDNSYDLYRAVDKDKNRMIKDFGRYIITSLINSSIPGALKVLSKSNVLQLYQHSINQHMQFHTKDGVYDFKNSIILSLYFDSIWRLLPYLKDDNYKLDLICYNFHRSRLWDIIWNLLLDLDFQSSDPDINILNVKIMFIKFLRLSTGIIYGLRGKNFISQYNEDKINNTWAYIFKMLYNTTIPNLIASKLYKYIADLLLISYADKSLKIFLKFHSIRLKNVLEVNLTNLSNQNSKDSYHSRCCDQIRAIYSLFKNGIVDKTLRLLYKYSSLNDPILVPSKLDTEVDCFADKMIPRILPCFNSDCAKIFHMDNPEVHVSSDSDFRYCEKCGIPSYCGEECLLSHWDSSHQYVCNIFKNLPTSLKFISTHGYFISFID